MNDWREGAWVVLVVMSSFVLAELFVLLDALLWFLVPLLPTRVREISRSFGRTDDTNDEKVRALWTGLMVLGAIFSAYVHLWLACSFMLGAATALTFWQRYETWICTRDRIDPN